MYTGRVLCSCDCTDSVQWKCADRCNVQVHYTLCPNSAPVSSLIVLNVCALCTFWIAAIFSQSNVSLRPLTVIVAPYRRTHQTLSKNNYYKGKQPQRSASVSPCFATRAVSGWLGTFLCRIIAAIHNFSAQPFVACHTGNFCTSNALLHSKIAGCNNISA